MESLGPTDCLPARTLKQNYAGQLAIPPCFCAVYLRATLVTSGIDKYRLCHFPLLVEQHDHVIWTCQQKMKYPLDHAYVSLFIPKRSNSFEAINSPEVNPRKERLYGCSSTFDLYFLFFF